MPKGPEHLDVRLPLVERLKSWGWSEGQLQFKPEWRVPRTPSQASRRELGQSFDAWPVDLVIFESDDTVGEWEHVLVLFELKAPDHVEGRNQLEILLSLEPRARAGYWTNGSDSLLLLRAADGSFESHRGADPPKPTDSLAPAAPQPLTFMDLEEPDRRTLREKLDRVFGSIVARDTRSTRPDDRLNHLCNLLLIKLESDKRGKANPDKALLFQPMDDETTTAKVIRNLFEDLKRTQTDVFAGAVDMALQLDDHSIHQVVYELADLRLVDVSPQTVAEAFQIFRNANLKAAEGQYFTPHRVISSAVRLMEISYDDKIIDPACGTGGFLVEAYLELKRRNPSLTEADLRSWAHRHLYGVDKDDINVKLARAIMQIIGDGSGNIYVGDSIRQHKWTDDYPHLTGPLKDGQFTCVITNPPFGKDLKVSKIDSKRSKYSIAQAASTSGMHRDLEIGLVFLERAWNLLAVGGRLGIVLPETYFFSSSYEWLQSWIQERLVLRGMLNIPMEAFQGFCRAKTNFYVFEKLQMELADAS